MNRITKVIVPFILTVASSLAMAEGGSERTLNRLNDSAGVKPTLQELVKEGKVLSIAPAGATGATGIIQNYRTSVVNHKYV
ncbi:co-regulatory protein PtrA N-terminal domain-containing protein (plasmid) [Pseudomonas luteola]